MFIFNIHNHLSLSSAIIDCLKIRGVKYKLPKKTTKASSQTHCDNIKFVFGTTLKETSKANVVIKNGGASVDVPEFLVEACAYIEQHGGFEGLFRKGGSTCKQRELKKLINSGGHISSDCHVIDVCNIVKLFLRELAEPVLPYYCHDMLLSCMMLPTEAQQKNSLLLACLLLNMEHLTTLTFFLEFLYRIAERSDENKMDAKNLATVLAPSLMPVDPKTKLRSDFNFNYHISVIELLIRSANDIGVVPPQLAEQAMHQGRKKRRSASITRMFTGIRKMVGRAPSPQEVVVPPLSPRKRKSPELMPPAVTIKKRREMADITPTLCRMGGYSQSSLRRHKSEDLLEDSPRIEILENEVDAPLTCGPASRTINKRRMQGMKASKSTSSLLSSKRKSLERRLSNMGWRKGRNSKVDVANVVEEPKEELVTISRKEYESMKNKIEKIKRVSLEQQQLVQQIQNINIRRNAAVSPIPDIVKDVSHVDAVQEEFQRVTEQSEQIGPQIKKDVRLRWSADHRIARSPSERKIGTLRRRSKELARSNSAGAGTNLQRGRPNTRQTGLPSPAREMNAPRNANSAKQSSPSNSRPQVANSVLSSSRFRHLKPSSPDRRMSIVSLRKNNSGMVQAKAKFFNSLNSTEGEGEVSLEQSGGELVRHASLMKENRQPMIKPVLATAHALKTPRSQAKPAARLRATPLKALPDNFGTPLRSVRRSPRILARSLSQRVT